MGIFTLHSEQLTLPQVHMYAKEIIEASWPVILTTIGDNGLPVSRAMTNLHWVERTQAQTKFFASQGEWNVCFRTHRSTDKVRQIHKFVRANAYFCEANKKFGVNLIGRVELFEDQQTKEILWHREWECYYPCGPEDEEYGLIKLHTERLRIFLHLSELGDQCINLRVEDMWD